MELVARIEVFLFFKSEVVTREEKDKSVTNEFVTQSNSKEEFQ